MRLLLTLILMSFLGSISAQETITYPYNPDGDTDGYVFSPDLLDLLSAYGNEFTPTEIFVDGVSLGDYLINLNTLLESINTGSETGEFLRWNQETQEWEPELVLENLKVLDIEIQEEAVFLNGVIFSDDVTFSGNNVTFNSQVIFSDPISFSEEASFLSNVEIQGELAVTNGVIGHLTGDISGNAETVTNGIYNTSSVTELSDVSSAGSGSILTSSERTKLSGIASGAEVNVQSDWNGSGEAQILNKPTTISAAQTTKLAGIQAGAQVNPTMSNYVNTSNTQTITGVKTFKTTYSGTSALKVEGRDSGIEIKLTQNNTSQSTDDFITFKSGNGSVMGRIEGRPTFFGDNQSAAYSGMVNSVEDFMGSDVGNSATGVVNCNWTLRLQDATNNTNHYKYTSGGTTVYCRPEAWVWAEDGDGNFYTDGEKLWNGHIYRLKRFWVLGNGQYETDFYFPVRKDYDIIVQYVLTGHYKYVNGTYTNVGGFNGCSMYPGPNCCSGTCSGWSGYSSSNKGQNKFFRYWMSGSWPNWQFYGTDHNLIIQVWQPDDHQSITSGGAPNTLIEYNGDEPASFYSNHCSTTHGSQYQHGGIGTIGQTQHKHDDGDDLDCSSSNDLTEGDPGYEDQGGVDATYSGGNLGGNPINTEVFEFMLSTLELIVNVINFATSWLSVLDWEDVSNKAFDAAMSFVNWAGMYLWNSFDTGMAYESGSGDYAEWLKKADVYETLTFGDVVGVKGGEVSKTMANPDHYMVVSKSPALIGNMQKEDEEWKYEKIAFMGQVPVKVFGKCSVGDFILPSGANDGFAIAVAESDMRPLDYANIIGVAWGDVGSTEKGRGYKYVNTAVGINQNNLSKLVDEMWGVINEMSEVFNDMQYAIGKLDATYKPHEFTTHVFDVAASNNLFNETESSDISQEHTTANYVVEWGMNGKPFETKKELGQYIIDDFKDNRGLDVSQIPLIENMLLNPEIAEDVCIEANEMLQKIMSLIPESYRNPELLDYLLEQKDENNIERKQ